MEKAINVQTMYVYSFSSLGKPYSKFSTIFFLNTDRHNFAFFGDSYANFWQHSQLFLKFYK